MIGGSKQKGFTIVELLIVIVVIAILAAITIVAYNGIQARARDAQRSSDISSLAKGLELYYIDKGEYPDSYNGGTTSAGNYWTSTADGSWVTFLNRLAPYMKAAGLKDPVSTPGTDSRYGSGYNYFYYSNTSTYCGASVNQMYIIAYKMDTQQKNTLQGECSSNPLIYTVGGVSSYRVSKAN